MASASTFKVEHRWRGVFLATLAVTAVAKGAAYLPGYSIDDYGLALNDARLDATWTQGRFAAYALTKTLWGLQLDPRHARVFFVTFALLASAALGTMVARTWRAGRSAWLAVTVAALVANHPFTAEIFTFRTALATAILPLGVLALLLVPRRWSRRGLFGGALLVALTLGVYQSLLQYAVMVVLGGLAINVVRVARIQKRHPALVSVRSAATPQLVGLMVCVVLGTVAYVAIGLIAARVFQHVEVTKFRLLQLPELGARAGEVLRVLQYRFLEPNPLLGATALRLQDFLLTVALVGLLWLAARRPHSWRAAGTALAALPLITAILLWCVGIIAFGRTFWPAPRVMAHTGLFWAAVLVVGGLALPTILRPAPLALATVLLLSYVGTNNRILQDQWRLNFRDAHKGNRILARIEQLPGSATVRRIAFEGDDWWYPLGYQTSDMDMNISAFGPVRTTAALLQELSGRRFDKIEDPAFARQYCAGREPWPAPESVAIRDGVAIVCFGP